MTHLTEAEKAHGWAVTYEGLVEWREGVVQVRLDRDHPFAVCVSGDNHTTEHCYWHEDEVGGLIFALLQAKGIHRRLRAEMTNTTHGGTDGR